MNQKNLLFWQPKFDLLRTMSESKAGRISLIVLNYLIWLFLFFISYLLIKNQINVFWQILIATFISEVIEKILKRKIFWRRPMFEHKNKTPVGLVDSWYKTGSFPSGHTIKAVYFFLFIIQYGIFSPLIFTIFIIPLLVFRIIIGFHYPVDMLGGIVIGFLIWLFSSWITLPETINHLIQTLFNFVFFIK